MSFDNKVYSEEVEGISLATKSILTPGPSNGTQFLHRNVDTSLITSQPNVRLDLFHAHQLTRIFLFLIIVIRRLSRSDLCIVEPYPIL